MLIQGQNWLIDLIRYLLSSIDSLLFRILAYVIRLIFDIANFSIAGSETLKYLYSKVYVVLTVYMLFKLSFTFINYIVNPEALSDDKQGVSKIIRNAIIMILLLIILPGIFTGQVFGNENGNLIVRIQKAGVPLLTQILLSDSKEKVIVDKSDNKLTYNNSKKVAEDMALAIAKVFYHPAYKTHELVCNNNNNNNIKAIEEIDDITGTISDSCKRKKNKNIYKEGNYYDYSYVYIISTIVTVFLIYLLIKMAIVVGKRTFKLIVLEIIFPIPVIMLIDPKALDASDSPFNAWLHSFISTFLELFFQLGTLYLFLNIINILIKAFAKLDEKGIKFDNLLLELALIVSLVYFVGELPIFVKKALGVKEEKSPSDAMGAIIAGTTAYGAAKVAKAKEDVVNGAKNTTKNVGKGIASSISSGVASSRNGGSFGEGAKAGLKRSMGLDPNKSMKDNAKDKMKETRAGKAYTSIRKRNNNNNSNNNNNNNSNSNNNMA